MSVENLWEKLKNLFGELYKEMNETIALNLKEAERIIDEWWDFSKIKRLTPELVKSLIEKNKWNELNLSWLTFLDKETARELVKWNWMIRLNFSLIKLDKETTKELANCNWIIPELNWLNDITYEIVEKMVLLKEKLKVDNDNVKGMIEEVETFYAILNRVKNRIKETGNMNTSDVDILYDFWDNIIRSWWQKTQVKNLNIYSDKIELEWLDVDLRIEEWLWLANFKNWVKNKYQREEKVSFEKEFISNRSLNKTLVIDWTVLISRRKLDENLPITKGYDAAVEKIVEWLNNR